MCLSIYNKDTDSSFSSIAELERTLGVTVCPVEGEVKDPNACLCGIDAVRMCKRAGYRVAPIPDSENLEISKITCSSFMDNLLKNGGLEVTWGCNEESAKLFEQHGMRIDHVHLREHSSGLLVLQIDWTVTSEESWRLRRVRQGATLSGYYERTVELEFMELPYTHVFKSGETYDTFASLDVGVNLSFPEMYSQEADPTLNIGSWDIIGLCNIKYGVLVYFAPPHMFDEPCDIYNSNNDPEFNKEETTEDKE